MKLKQNSYSKIPGVIFILLLCVSSSLQAQEKVPITTSSLEAKRIFLQGRNYIDLYQFPEAAERFEEAIQLDKPFALAHLYLSIAKTEATGYEEKPLKKAIKYADQVSEGERHMIHYAKAVTEKNNLAMNQHIEKLRNLHPGDERVHVWIGRYYYDNEDYNKALKHFKKATSINPNYHTAVNLTGYAYLAMNFFDDARMNFKKYLNMVPDVANPYDSYAEYLLKKGKFTPAIKYFNTALEYDSKFVSSYNGLADAYLFRGDFWRARENYRNYYEKAINNDQKFHALLMQSSIELHEDNIDAALKVLDKYIKLAEENNLPYYKINGVAYKGYVLAERGRSLEGMKYYQKATEMIEDEIEDDNLRSRLITRAKLWNFYALTTNGNMDEAEVANTKCMVDLRKNGNNDQWKMYHRLRGIMEIKKGNYDEAKSQLAESYDNPVTWYYMGLAWENSGHDKRAKKYYEKVVEHYDNSIELATLRNKAVAALKE
jgi:tetratricopeptide (TPR) repeat protein